MLGLAGPGGCGFSGGMTLDAWLGNIFVWRGAEVFNEGGLA